MYELVTAIRTVEARPPLVPLLAGVLAMDAAGLVPRPGRPGIGAAADRARRGDLAAGRRRRRYLRDVARRRLVALYVPFLAGFAVLLAHPDDGAARVLFIAHRRVQRHRRLRDRRADRQAPDGAHVSPKKSWEGFAGSLLAGGRRRRC